MSESKKDEVKEKTVGNIETPKNPNEPGVIPKGVGPSGSIPPIEPAIDPVRTNPENTQDGETIVNSEDLKDFKPNDKVRSPQRELQPPRFAFAPGETKDKLADLAMTISQDAGHPLHPLGLGLSTPEAIRNILTALHHVLDALADRGIIGEHETKPKKK